VQVSLDTASLNNLQQYMWSFNFQQMRVGFLYGHFLEDGSVKVEFIYEPPQSTTATSFELLEEEGGGGEEEEARVEALAGLLGVARVGWLVVHPPREEFFHLSGLEVLTAAELQLQAAQGVHDTAFVTVKMTLTADDEVDVYACQVSKQCMEMAAEGALEVSQHPGNCHIHETFTAKVELRVTDEVSTNFFMANVPIAQHDSTDFVSFFPRPHRLGQAAGGPEDLKAQLQRAGREGWTLLDVLSDFHLLLFLAASFLDLQQDLPKICQSLRDRSVPLDEGYSLLLRSIAGMD
jgi:nuclear protein localization protein 4 homolog